MVIRKFARTLTLLVVVLSATALAESLELNPNHPDRYVVREGDTLWDISAKFLREPWRWPAIWQANPQIDNPHLIYPGDELVLSYRGGVPVIEVVRGNGTIKMSPQVRDYPLERQAIPTIPIDAIQQFLSRPRLVDLELADGPYIVATGRESLVAGEGDTVYARGIIPDDGNAFLAYRPGSPLIDPDTEELLGYEALHVGDAIVQRSGDPSTLRLTKTYREVLAGDRLLPAFDEPINSNFYPRTPDEPVQGRVLAVLDGVSQIGQYQVVVLNRGTRDGIEVGNVLGVWQAGEVIDDRYAVRQDLPNPPSYIERDPARQGGIDGLTVAADGILREIGDFFTHDVPIHLNLKEDPEKVVTLPDERAGIVMVFQPYEHISYALVMKAIRPMHIHDTVRNLPTDVALR